VEIKTKKSFNDLVRDLTEEIIDEEELDEMTTTSDIAGYSTPFAFDPEGEKIKKKFGKKKNSHRKKIGEALETKDLDIIRKLIRAVIADVYRDIWIKRGTWK
tara:strand:- start:249 stop:554 length:306 start_codon:yes stop_codon:yes gene_type:complete